MRTPCEILEDHWRLALEHRFEEDIERNFADDTILLTGYGIFRGKDGIRQKVALLEQHLPNGRYFYQNRMCERNLGFLEWTAEGDGVVVDDGADSYLMEGDKIRMMTIHYSVKPRPT
jgi:hypothetical protein